MLEVHKIYNFQQIVTKQGIDVGLNSKFNKATSGRLETTRKAHILRCFQGGGRWGDANRTLELPLSYVWPHLRGATDSSAGV